MKEVKGQCITTNGIRIGAAHDLSNVAINARIAAAGIVIYDNHIAAQLNVARNSRNVIEVVFT